jgi:hypothetical protein
MTTTASIVSGGVPPRPISQSKDKNALTILQKIDISKKPRGNVLPALEPIKKDSIKGDILGKSSIKGFDSTKPIKVLQNQTSDSSLNTSSISIQGTNLNPTKPPVAQ